MRFFFLAFLDLSYIHIMAFSGFGTQTGFGGTTTPIFSSTWNTAPQALPPPPVAAAAANGSDKGQIVACLTESKNVQLAILQELKTMNERLKPTATPTPTPIGFMATPATHTSVFCNCCNKQNITGARYKCLFCKDFDMCEECEARTFTTHDPSHFFIKIKDSNAFNNKMASKPPLFNAV